LQYGEERAKIIKKKIKKKNYWNTSTKEQLKKYSNNLSKKKKDYYGNSFEHYLKVFDDSVRNIKL
jgi:hypothetical protein